MNLHDFGTLKRRLELPARWVVALVTFVGFIFNMGLRTTMNIAIVAMVNFTAVRENAKLFRQRNSSEIGSFSTPDFSNSTAILERCDSSETGFASSSVPSGKIGNFSSGTALHTQKEGTFVWDETAQGAILGSFYWGYILTQLLGGRLSERFGPKLVMLASLVSAAVVTMLIPSVASWGLGWVIALRIIQGICEGPTYPTMNVIVSRWAVAHERSRMLSVVYVGGTLGGLIALWLGGMVIPSLGYASIFYISGIGCLIWAGAFWLLAFDSPSEHPRISQKELDMFPAHSSATKKVTKVPWKEIISCRGVWAVVMCSFTKGWALAVTLMMPIYLKAVLSFNVKSSGTFSALPYVGRVTFPVLCSVLVDWIISKRRFSTTNIRKSASTLDYVGNAICFLIVSLVGCDYVSVLSFLSLAAALGGAGYSGYTACLVEMSPTYAGTIGGLSSMGFSLGSLLSPLVNGAILQGKQNLQQWSIVFQVTAAMNLAMACIFWLLGTAERQSFDPGFARDDDKDSINKNKIKGSAENGIADDDRMESKALPVTKAGLSTAISHDDLQTPPSGVVSTLNDDDDDGIQITGVQNRSFVLGEDEAYSGTSPSEPISNKERDDFHETRLI